MGCERGPFSRTLVRATKALFGALRGGAEAYKERNMNGTKVNMLPEQRDPEYTYIVAGKKIYGIPPLVFDRMEKVWPLLDELRELPVIDGKEELPPRERAKRYRMRVGIVLRILSAALDRDCPEGGLGQHVRPGEEGELFTKFSELMQKSGLTSGEPQPSDQARVNDSTGTSAR